MTPIRLSIPLLALALLTACTSQPDKRLLQYLNTDGFGNRYTGNAEEENWLSIGDKVTIMDALHQNEIYATETVAIDGTIMLPEIDAVHVAGNTRSEVEALLTEKYAPYYTDGTDIKVRIQTEGKKYFIFGEVESDGEKIFPGDLTVFEAVMAARPDENTANLGRVRIIRADPRDPLVITVNIGDMLEGGGDSTFNTTLRERDIIFVPPTLLAKLGYFLDDLLFPVKKVLQGVGGALFGINTGIGRRRGVGGGFVGGGFGGGGF